MYFVHVLNKFCSVRFCSVLFIKLFWVNQSAEFNRSYGESSGAYLCPNWVYALKGFHGAVVLKYRSGAQGINALD